MAPPHLSMPPLPSTEHRRCSKAQMRFFQILHIISVFPTADVTDNLCLTHGDDHGVVVDLNIRLCPPTELTEPSEYAVGENCVFEKNDRCKSASQSELAVEEERATEHSEISHVGDHSSGIDYNGESKLVLEGEKPRDEGYLGLLIEAAQLILGDDSEHDEKPPSHKRQPRMAKSKYIEPPATTVKRKQQCWTAAAEAEWYAEFEDTSPVVKSKRGRNQVLPFRYRDSVVEPLVRWTSTCKSISTRRSK